MPSRLIREGILNSDRVDQLGAEAEVFYRRLMSKVDDFGLFDARPAVLLTSLYPLRTATVTEDNCLQWLTDCVNARLVILYQIDGKPFLKMLDTKWKTRSEPKFPKPVNGCKHLKAPVALDVVVDVVRSRLIEVVDVVVDGGECVVVDGGQKRPPVPTFGKGQNLEIKNEGPTKTIAQWAALLSIKPKLGEADAAFQERVRTEIHNQARAGNHGAKAWLQEHSA